jgi:nitrite reductase/ring-hydroxylating ferredoxin subunit
MGVQRIRVGELEDLPLRRGKLVRVRGEEIAVWRVEGSVYAISAVCAHQHVATLHEGLRNGTTIACPLHGWTYSLENGRAVAGSGVLRTYPVNVELGVVYLEVDEDV